MKKINNLLLCVGAQKAGTTWLHSIVKNSPDIEFSRFKEIHYFDMVDNVSNLLPNQMLGDMARAVHVTKQDIENKVYSNHQDAVQNIRKLFDEHWYVNMFNQHARYCADFSPEYALLSQEGFNHIKRISNNQKIIFIMRDPVERALSAIQYSYRHMPIEIQNESPEVILQRSRAQLFLSRSRYQDTIPLLDTLFEAKDVLYLFYEDVMEDKFTALNKVEEFLDIKLPELEDELINKVVNKSKKFEFDDKVIEGLEENLKDTYRYINNKFAYRPRKWRVVE